MLELVLVLGLVQAPLMLSEAGSGACLPAQAAPQQQAAGSCSAWLPLLLLLPLGRSGAGLSLATLRPLTPQLAVAALQLPATLRGRLRLLAVALSDLLQMRAPEAAAPTAALLLSAQRQPRRGPWLASSAATRQRSNSRLAPLAIPHTATPPPPPPQSPITVVM
jgi:hypothetical protein